MNVYAACRAPAVARHTLIIVSVVGCGCRGTNCPQRTSVRFGRILPRIAVRIVADKCRRAPAIDAIPFRQMRPRVHHAENFICRRPSKADKAMTMVRVRPSKLLERPLHQHFALAAEGAGYASPRIKNRAKLRAQWPAAAADRQTEPRSPITVITLRQFLLTKSISQGSARRRANFGVSLLHDCTCHSRCWRATVSLNKMHFLGNDGDLRPRTCKSRTSWPSTSTALR